MFKKVLYNTGSQIIGKVITASITLAITVIIGRTLGESGYGDFTKIFVFVGYFYTLADFGFNAIFVRLPKEELNLFKVLVGLRLVIGVTLAAIATLIAFLLPYNSAQNIGFDPLVKIGIIIASATIITQALFTTANAYFQKNLRYDLSTIAAVTGYIFILAVAAVVGLTSKGILGYTIAYVVGGFVLVSAAYLIISKKLRRYFLPVFNWQQSIHLLKLSWPIGTALVFNLIYFRIDVFILSNFRSSYEVGVYGLAYQFFEAALAIPIFFANAIYPVLAKLYTTNIEDFKKQVLFWIKVLISVSVILALALIIVSGFIPFIFHQRFHGSTQALQILALGMPFFFISALFWHLLIIYGRQKFLIYIYGTGAAVNLIANLVFIPQFGYLAASIITVVSEGLITLLLFLAIRFQSGSGRLEVIKLETKVRS